MGAMDTIPSVLLRRPARDASSSALLNRAWRRLAAALLGALPLIAASAPMAEEATFNAVADTFINSGHPGNNAGGHTHFAAGRDGAGGVRRGLLRFDVASIPAGSTVSAVELRLTVSDVPGFGSVNSNFDLFRLEAAWGQGAKVGNNGSAATTGEATWSARFATTADWTAPGAKSDAVASASASAFVGSTEGQVVSWTGPGLVSDVQSWVDHAEGNFGWLLASQAEASSRSARGFASRESGLGAGVLIVRYTPVVPSNVPPSVAITQPVNGSSFAAPATVMITAEAGDTDGAVASVEFFDSATSLGKLIASPYTLTVGLFPGEHTLTAVATDDDGASTTSATVTITVGNTVIADPIAERIPKGDLTIELEILVDGLVSPLGMAVLDDASGRLFVYDQVGRAWVVTPQGRQPTPLLDVRSRLVALGNYDERGLLGFATHPNFAQNPRIYTYTSEPLDGPADFQNGLGAANNHQSVIAEWLISSTDPNRVDPASRREILRIDQPQSNHNGGPMHFGPDGLLYVVLGDGGQAHDAGNGHSPGGSGQDPSNIWGSLIRIDVDGNNAPNGQYGVPSDNPLVEADGLDEIFAYGFRNPFAFSFDRQTGALYLADVGQGKVEEINLVTKGGNYGWNIKEGPFWFDGSGNLVTAPVRPVPPGLVDPIAIYDHDDGSAVIGGYVYRGTALPALAGRYVFGDWGKFSAPSGRLFYLDPENKVNEFRIGPEDRALNLWIKGFGQGTDGELYLLGSTTLGPSGATGQMLKLIPAAAPVEINRLTADAGRLRIEWQGGTGPFVVQRKNAVREPDWLDEAVVATRSCELSTDRASSFFRVRDAGQGPGTRLTTTLSGAAEWPNPATTSATGFGLFSLEGDTLLFSIEYSRLTGPATAAHIHGPAGVDGTAPPVLNLAPYSGGGFASAGVLSGAAVVSEALRTMILSGQTYVNIHTASYPGGEIRGQVVP